MTYHGWSIWLMLNEPICVVHVGPLPDPPVPGASSHPSRGPFVSKAEV